MKTAEEIDTIEITNDQILKSKKLQAMLINNTAQIQNENTNSALLFTRRSTSRAAPYKVPPPTPRTSEPEDNKKCECTIC